MVTHSNGHDANEVITRREPDLVVLDVMLPGKSGLFVVFQISPLIQEK